MACSNCMTQTIEIMKATLQVIRGEASLHSFSPEIQAEVGRVIASRKSDDDGCLDDDGDYLDRKFTR